MASLINVELKSVTNDSINTHQSIQKLWNLEIHSCKWTLQKFSTASNYHWFNYLFFSKKGQLMFMYRFKGKKMRIPFRLRSSVWEGRHSVNQRVIGMLASARDRFFTPGLDAALHFLHQQCRQCNEHAPWQSAELPKSTPQPHVPIEQAVTDLCNLAGHLFLIYTNRFSTKVEVELLRTNNLQPTKVEAAVQRQLWNLTSPMLLGNP